MAQKWDYTHNKTLKVWLDYDRHEWTIVEQAHLVEGN